MLSVKDDHYRVLQPCSHVLHVCPPDGARLSTSELLLTRSIRDQLYVSSAATQHPTPPHHLIGWSLSHSESPDTEVTGHISPKYWMFSKFQAASSRCRVGEGSRAKCCGGTQSAGWHACLGRVLRTFAYTKMHVCTYIYILIYIFYIHVCSYTCILFTCIYCICIYFFVHLFIFKYIYIHIYSPPRTTRGNALLGAQISTEPQSQTSRNPNNPKI